MSLNCISDINRPALYLNPNVNTFKCVDANITNDIDVDNNLIAKRVGINMVPVNSLDILGNGKISMSNSQSYNASDNLNNLILNDVNSAMYSGGNVSFAANNKVFASIKGVYIDDSISPNGAISLCVRKFNENIFRGNLIVDKNGVGIGNITPSTQVGQNLSVKDGILFDVPTLGGNIFFSNGDVYIQRVPTTNDIRLQATGGGFGVNKDITGVDHTFETINIYYSGSLTHISDERMKKDIEILNNNDCLNILNYINPCKFKFIDNNKGNNYKYGFIAQQVKNHFPDAVNSSSSDFLPNILRKCNIINNELIFNDLFNDVFDLDINNEYLIYTDENMNCEYCKIKLCEKVDEITYKLNCDNIKDCENVFIYGSKVNNINSLDSNALFTINFAATKELLKKVNDLENKINELENKIITLENK